MPNLSKLAKNWPVPGDIQSSEKNKTSFDFDRYFDTTETCLK